MTLALLPSSALGFARFGSTLAGTPDPPAACPTSSDCSDVQALFGGGRPAGAPMDGVVTRWRVKTSAADAAMTFQVVRAGGPEIGRAHV